MELLIGVRIPKTVLGKAELFQATWFSTPWEMKIIKKQ